MKGYQVKGLADGESVTVNAAGDKIACYTADVTALFIQMIWDDGEVSDRSPIAPSVQYRFDKRGKKFKGFILTNESGFSTDALFVCGFDDFQDNRAAVTVSTVTVNQASGSNPWITQPKLVDFEEGDTYTVSGTATPLMTAAPTKENKIVVHNTNDTEQIRVGASDVEWSSGGGKQGILVGAGERVTLENIGFKLYGISDGSSVDVECSVMEAA